MQETLPEFRAIRLLDDLEISLESATTPGYTVTADDNLIDILKFEVTGDTLFISSFYTVTAKKQLDITILYTDLQGIALDAGSLITPTAVQTDGIQIRVANQARMDFRTRGSFVDVLVEGLGRGDFHLEADSVHIRTAGKAEARLYQQGSTLSVYMKDDSDVQLEGMTDFLDAQLEGGAELKAERLDAVRVFAGVRGSSHAHIRATEQLELESEGSANTYLYGNPEITIKTFSGTSELYKRIE